MKKLVVVMAYIAVIAMGLSACGNSDVKGGTEIAQETVAGGYETGETEKTKAMEDAEEETSTDELLGDENSEDAEDVINYIGEMEVEKDLFDVTITIPAYYGSSDITSQEDADAFAEENGYTSITLNEDGSLTCVMPRYVHDERMAELRESFNETLEDMVGSEGYPNFVSVTANEDFTRFEVVTTSEELSLSEGMSTLSFYFYGGLYSVFNGTEVDNINVKFINERTGEIIVEANSKDAGANDEDEE